MAYDLEEITEVVRVLNLVEERKKQARDYSWMASEIAQKLGREISSETYEYKEESLNIWEKKCYDRDSDYIGSVIDIRVPKNKNVFRSEDSIGITTYIPGTWEQRLKELYEPLKPKPQSIERKVEIPSMSKRELQDLKDRFGIK